MARARNIKPGLFKNEILGVADPIYTLLFEGLWVLADREGRLEDRPLRIKAEIFPYRDGLSVDEMLNWLQANGFIRRYVARGKKCIVVCEFVKHQNPHKNESESELPAPEDDGAKPEEIGRTSEFIGSTRADSLSSDSLNSDSIFEPNGSVGKSADQPGFAEFWKTWPPNDRKQAKGKCLAAWKKAGAERDAAAVLAHVERLKDSESWKKQGGQFVPAPLVYLGQRRWEGADDDAAEGVGAGVGVHFV